MKLNEAIKTASRVKRGYGPFENIEEILNSLVTIKKTIAQFEKNKKSLNKCIEVVKANWRRHKKAKQ